MQTNTKPLYIFDIDGTLCNIEHRLHFLQRKDWDGFHLACVNDKPNWPVIHIMETLMNSGIDILLFSGRSEIVRNETIAWLNEYTPWTDFKLISAPYLLTMRREKDYTEDHLLKERWLLNMLDVDRQRLIGVFDDRKRVVDMWRSHGVACFQVAPGEF